VWKNRTNAGSRSLKEKELEDIMSGVKAIDAAFSKAELPLGKKIGGVTVVIHRCTRPLIPRCFSRCFRNQYQRCLSLLYQYGNTAA
jgi:hypothetical protein